MHEITQQINIQVLDTPLPPNTGLGTNFIDFAVHNNIHVIGIIAIILFIAAFFWLRRRSAHKASTIKIGIVSSTFILLTVLALQFVNFAKAASLLSLDAGILNVTITKPDLSATTSDTLRVPIELSPHSHLAFLKSVSDNRITIDLNSNTMTDQVTLLTDNDSDTSHALDYTINITSDLPAGNYVAYITHAVIEQTGEHFMFTIDTRMTNTPDTDPSHYDNTFTTFYIPTSGIVNFDPTSYEAPPHPYNWAIDWGDGTKYEIVTGTASDISDGIIHNYASPGEYQITIRPYGVTTDGWMNAFGFFSSSYGEANQPYNKNMFKSIDTPIPPQSRTRGSTYRFAYMFHEARNAIGIPADVFSLIDTSGDDDLSDMFNNIFNYYAYNSTTATIPTGLFDQIDTSSAANLSGMFNGVFVFYAYNSTTATIPNDLFHVVDTSSATDTSYLFRNAFGAYAYSSPTAIIPSVLFSTIDTSNVTNVAYMFSSTFAYCAYSSTTATIPTGLFDTIDTSNATDVRYLFSDTFRDFARSSTTATIPTGLFDTIDTSNATNMTNLFASTFDSYARSSTTATIPNNLFNLIDLTNATSINGLFNNTFTEYAYANDTPTTDVNNIWGGANFAGKITTANAYSVFNRIFYGMKSLTGSAQTFIDNKIGGVNPSRNTFAFRNTQVTDLALLDPFWR
ncbi:BspA family leucine-rich repeat surface protein [Candidatus Saccharibacteria bacterium]|nr:BspA family leucine-rich repeat surface protein [Candidatus Saccharibacteria bacterium]